MNRIEAIKTGKCRLKVVKTPIEPYVEKWTECDNCDKLCECKELGCVIDITMTRDKHRHWCKGIDGCIRHDKLESCLISILTEKLGNVEINVERVDFDLYNIICKFKDIKCVYVLSTAMLERIDFPTVIDNIIDYFTNFYLELNKI